MGLMVHPEGIEALCFAVGVDHTDVRMLMLAWKMNAEKQGYFTQDEWHIGLKALRVDTIGKLKKRLSNLMEEVMKPENFEDFYLYAFRYCLTEEKQKSIDIESICILLDLVLGSQFQPQVDTFTEYLKISFPDLENYDTTEAWSLVLDNYVEWMKEKAKLAAA
ncbi:hypothetical protein RJ639_013555 [Escallonia herrerae]|uniref:Defective in cullin neddylation protein n=1 Tax=Escallonia herrerae TaxID=1293975 RepID=A0AA88VFU4_9ASTE|nr:hypothetical protein RJ639_013555 [Escallonia herrerae]